MKAAFIEYPIIPITAGIPIIQLKPTIPQSTHEIKVSSPIHPIKSPYLLPEAGNPLPKKNSKLFLK